MQARRFTERMKRKQIHVWPETNYEKYVGMGMKIVLITNSTEALKCGGLCQPSSDPKQANKIFLAVCP